MHGPVKYKNGGPAAYINEAIFLTTRYRVETANDIKYRVSSSIRSIASFQLFKFEYSVSTNKL